MVQWFRSKTVTQHHDTIQGKAGCRHIASLLARLIAPCFAFFDKIINLSEHVFKWGTTASPGGRPDLYRGVLLLSLGPGSVELELVGISVHTYAGRSPELTAGPTLCHGTTAHFYSKSDLPPSPTAGPISFFINLAPALSAGPRVDLRAFMSVMLINSMCPSTMKAQSYLKSKRLRNQYKMCLLFLNHTRSKRTKPMSLRTCYSQILVVGHQPKVLFMY